MISVIILDNGEPNVIRLTYENLYREIKDIEGAELLVATDWFKLLPRVKNKYICLVEPDCLVSSGYFASQMGLIKKNSYLRKLAVLGSATGVNSFGNRFFGFAVNELLSQPMILPTGEKLQTVNKKLEPARTKKSTVIHPAQIVYLPGAVINTSILVGQLKLTPPEDWWYKDLVRLSAKLCLEFWQRGTRISINPNTTYVTTEKYVNDLNETEYTADLIAMFKRESI